MEAVDNTIKPTLAGLASRIRNIDGNPLRSAIRNVKPSTANDGNSSHVEADATKVVRSPNRVSFDDNIRVSQINPNDINVASELNEENVKEMRNAEIVKGAAVAIPLEEVEAVTSRFANTLYGYFIGKR
nr:zinc knuckle CX2CX4HX4C [Tanacetum cinerariifolium]